jgi:hypothetical protein
MAAGPAGPFTSATPDAATGTAFAEVAHESTFFGETSGRCVQ